MSETTAGEKADETTDQPAATGRRKPRGSYAKTGMKRAAILEAALAVFAKGGYRAGSLREVAAEVGMSEAGLLHHFPNKSALLAEVLDLRDQKSITMVPLDAEDPGETLRGLVELARYNASVPGVVDLYCTLSAEATSPDHPAHGYFVRRYTDTIGRLTRSFTRCAERGTLRPGIRPESAARATVALMDGLQVQWLLDRDSVDMAEELDAYLRSIVDLDAT
ncbi:TetR/AcrR family transcriptional regulator [Agromyces sp. Soil535]|uniref:TetR/AcrR family transcriptional regulator n=1 Tax=Agromyces sp. Soil535 TaxID=1736390 RepID=UPI0006F37BD2|nr:TetR/AcrR family transcriptional regulator [Agromyces sp. Soil535]KRE31310.1 TetR family transcriptional regulator [Agromyces sp. Soil535]